MLRWRNEEKLAQKTRRRLKKATGSVVKRTNERLYIAFFDTESGREEYAASLFMNSISSSQVHFDAFQLDPGYPDFCDGLWISWHVTYYQSNLNQCDSVYTLNADPFYPEFPENFIIKESELVPTNVSGTMEFYGYFTDQEDAYEEFLDELQIACQSRIEQSVQAPKLHGIYATKIPETGSWTRVQVTCIADRLWIYGSLIDVGGEAKPILIRDLIFIPNYLADNDWFVKRFQLAGCKTATENPLMTVQMFLIDAFKNEDFTLKMQGQVRKDRILVDILLKDDQHLSILILENKLAWHCQQLVPEFCIQSFIQ